MIAAFVLIGGEQILPGRPVSERLETDLQLSIPSSGPKAARRRGRTHERRTACPR